MPSTTSQGIIDKLRIPFGTLGFPELIITDSGTAFTRGEFKLFMKRNGVLHCTTAPYYPSSNGLAERAVLIFKQGMKKLTNANG